jgi:hypothetical protein
VVVRAIIEAVELDGEAHAWKQGSARVQLGSGDKARWMQTGERGAADIAVLVEARPWAVPLYLEVKTGTGKQSAAQRAWQEKVEDLGAWYAVVGSVSEAREAIAKARQYAQWRGDGRAMARFFAMNK